MLLMLHIYAIVVFGFHILKVYRTRCSLYLTENSNSKNRVPKITVYIQKKKKMLQIVGNCICQRFKVVIRHISSREEMEKCPCHYENTPIQYTAIFHG